jgi:hypothetical protein
MEDHPMSTGRFPAERDAFNINREMKQALNEPIDYSQAFDRIIRLVSQHNIYDAVVSLEALKGEIKAVFASLFHMLRDQHEASYRDEVDKANLRLRVIEGAISYAELNDDVEAIAIGQDLLSKETSFLSGLINDLDSEL